MNRGVFRGSQFTVETDQAESTLPNLITQILDDIKLIAQKYGLRVNTSHAVPGIFSIWRGKTEQWNELVHGVCRSKDNAYHPNPDRPTWCGDSKDRPSGYTVREHEEYCLVTVFDQEIEATLREHGYRPIWNNQAVAL